MALEVAQGTFALRTTTGAQSVTGLSFQPKCVLFQITKLTATGEASGLGMGWGCATGASNEFAQSFSALFGETNTETYRSHYDNACLTLHNEISTVLVLADFTSFNSDGFTINVSIASGTAYLVSYLALGGAEASFELVNFYAPTSTGAAAVTTTFQPESCIVWSGSKTAASGNPSGNVIFSMGAGSSSTNRWVHSNSTEDATGTADSYGAYLTDHIIDGRTGTSATIWQQADLTSFNATDVTFTWGTVQATARLQSVLVWRGIQSTIGVETSNTTTGTKQTTGQNGTPKAIIAATRANTATGAANDLLFSYGFGISSSARSCITGTDDDAETGSMDNCSDIDDAAFLKMVSPNTGSITVLDEADISSFGSGAFTLTYPTADATARYFGYVTFADPADAGGISGNIFDGPIFAGRVFSGGIA